MRRLLIALLLGLPLASCGLPGSGENPTLQQARQELAKRKPASLLAARDLFRKVVESAPDSVEGWAGLAESSALAGLYGADLPAQTMPQAGKAAARALELNPQDALVHAVAGLVAYLHEWNWQEARKHFEQAIRLKPELGEAHHWFAMMLSATGRHREALDQISTAARLAPGSALYTVKVATVQANSGQSLAARTTLEAALDRFPESTLAWNELGLLDLRDGDNRSALAHFEESLQLEPDSDRALAGIAVARSRLGEPDAARQILAQLGELSSSSFVSPTIVAEAALAAGDSQSALDELEKAFQIRDPSLVYILTRPGLQPLFAEPKFRDLVARIGLR